MSSQIDVLLSGADVADAAPDGASQGGGRQSQTDKAAAGCAGPSAS